MDVNKELKFCEESKKKNFFFFLGGGGGGSGGGCERRIQVFVKIQTKNWGVSGVGLGRGSGLGGSGWM